jgi:hypothetical protein
MLLARLSSTDACPSFCARSAILQTCSLEICVGSLEHPGTLRREYSVHKVDEWPVSCLFFASLWSEMAWHCPFAPWEGHPEKRSEVGVLFLGDRSWPNTSVDEEEGC